MAGSRSPGRQTLICLSCHKFLIIVCVTDRSADKTIKVWDLGARTAVSTIQESGEVWGVAWRPRPPPHGSAGEFVTGGEDGVVRWWRGAGAG
jgi:WD40 repeat protein